MKKLLTLTAVGTLLAAPASAVQKCVALNSSDTTCVFTNLGSGIVDWATTCTTNATNVPIKGIGICSYIAGSEGDTRDVLTLNTEDIAANINCWCKMTSPAVSPWVYNGGDFTYVDDCMDVCGFMCTASAEHSSAFRSALFGSLAN